MELQVRQTNIVVPEEVMEHASITRTGFKVALSHFARSAKKRARMRNPIAPNAADIVNWVLWDTVTTAANTATPATYSFFTIPQGNSNKTKADTNVEQVMKLPAPLWFNTIALGIMPSPKMGRVDLAALFEAYYLEFTVGNKIYAEGPITCFPPGAGLMGAVATTNTTVEVGVISNGNPNQGNMFDLRLPSGLNLGNQVTDGLIGITILQDQQFKVEMKGTSFTTAASPATGLNVKALLWGILSRGVQ